MLSKRYEPTEVDRRTWLHVPSGTPWSTSSDTHQVIEKWKETSTYLYTPFWFGWIYWMWVDTKSSETNWIPKNVFILSG